MLMTGVIWIDKSPKKGADYRKWLGPDWQSRFTGYGIQVSNHSSWMDIMAYLTVQVPSFVAKEDVRNIIGVGKIAECIQCMFTLRGATSEIRAQTLKDIGER